MAQFRARRNIRCNGKRYLQGQVYDLAPEVAKLNENFVAVAAPTASKPEKKAEAAPAPKAEKPAEKPVEKAPEAPKAAEKTAPATK